MPLLSRVSGLNSVLARNIVEFRDAHGAFSSRAALLKVPTPATTRSGAEPSDFQYCALCQSEETGTPCWT